MSAGSDYRVYFLDEAKRFCGVEEIDAADDAAALELARESLAKRAFPAAEIWQRARQVGVIAREDAAADEAEGT